MSFSTVRSVALASGLALSVAAVAGAQTFNELIGLSLNEVGNFVTPTRDGGYAMTGVSQIPTGADPGDILVNRLAPDGSIIWSVKFGGVGLDVGYCIQETRDGGFIVAAETQSVGAVFNLALLRLDNAGNYMWSFVYDGDASIEDSVYAPGRLAGVTVRELEDGGFVLTGRKRFSPNTQDQAGVLVRTQPNGVQIFNRRYGDLRFDTRARISFTDVRQLPDGTFVISGTEESPNTASEPQDPLIARVDPAGNPIFFRNYPLGPNPNAQEHGTGDGIDVIGASAAPSLVITGATDGAIAGATNLHVIRTDLMGNFGYDREYLRMEPAFRAINQDQFAKVAIGGRVLAAGANASDAMLLRVDAATGIFDLGVAYGFMDRALGTSPIPLKGGYSLIGGVVPPTTRGFGGTDIELIQTNGVGDVPCLATRFVREPLTFDITPQAFQPLLAATQEFTFWQGSYVRWQQRVDVICDNRCARADFNGDGSLNPDDLGDFITCYFAAPFCPGADFNNDGNIDPDDLGDFITQYFGCL